MYKVKIRKDINDISVGYRIGVTMCGRFYIDDETAQEIEKIAGKIDRKQAKTGDVHPSEPALILRANHDDMAAEVLAWGYESARKIR